MNPAPTIEAMRTAAQALRSGDVREGLLAVQAAHDALDGAKAALLAELEASRDHELDGASTLGAWVRNEMRTGTAKASQLVRGAAALRELPLVAESAMAGRIGADHVRAFVFGLKHLGLEVMLELQQPLLTVAELKEPSALFEVLRDLKAVKHPEDLDDAFLKGMKKQDFTVEALPDGYHVAGFLNTVTGAKLRTVVDAISAPNGPDDTRTGAQRRVQGLDDLLSDVLGNGMPSDKGVKPHLSVFVDAETVAAAADRVHDEAEHPLRPPLPMPDVTPAHLAGFGPIGPHLLMYLACVSDATTFLLGEGGHGRQAQVLNAGRARYQPTSLQRRAVLARQQGVCAAPGCHHTHLEIHHSVWWSKGGTTDLDLLVGLCSRCHHLLHAGRLAVTGDAVDGFVFTAPQGRTAAHRRRRPSRSRAA